MRIQTMSGPSHNHCEIRITSLRVAKDAILGGLGQGHRLGQYWLGPARFADGADEVLQWRIAERAIEAYTKTRGVWPAAGDLPL